MLIHIILATFLISCISFVGVLLLHHKFKKMLHYLISFAAGTFIAVAFFDLMPEAVEHFGEAEPVFIYVVVGIVAFFFIERFVHWHHCGKDNCHRKSMGPMSLWGDVLHNFLDGIIIAGAFIADFNIGIITTLGIMFHEIPQEFGDFSVLLHSGYSKKQALKLNFLVALTAVAGGIIGYITFSSISALIPYALSFAAGGFVYIALSDIVPELHEHKHHTWIINIESFIFLATIILFYILFEVFAHAH